MKIAQPVRRRFQFINKVCVTNYGKQLDCWSYGAVSTVRVILFDFQQALDFIDHEILPAKHCNLDVPRSVFNWIIGSTAPKAWALAFNNHH